MKTRKNLALFVAICTVAAIYSCKGGMDPAKLFTKKWQFDSFKSKAYDEQMAMAKQMMDTIKDSARKAQMQANLQMQTTQMEAMKKMTLTCNVDGSCQISMPMMGKTQDTKGKWMLIADGKKVVMNYDGSPKADTMEIAKLTSDTMTVVRPDGRGGEVYTTFKSVQ